MFKPDIFSEANIRYRSPEKEPAWLNPILKTYFTDYSVNYLHRLEEQGVNSENYKLSLNSNNQERIFLLRRIKAMADPEQISFYLELITKLDRYGVKVSKVIPTSEGSLWTKQAEGNFALFDFLEAHHFSPTKQSLKNVAQEVAKLHLAFNKLEKPDIEKITRWSRQVKAYFNRVTSYSPEDWQQIALKVTAKENKNEIDELVLEKIPGFVATTQTVQSQSASIKNIPVEIIHSDLHPHNILMKKEEVAALIDFDTIRPSQQARDIAFVIYRLGRQFLAKEPAVKTAAQAIELRDIFLQSYQTVKPVTDEELSLMPLLLKDDYLTKILHVLRMVYEEDNYTWAKIIPNLMVALEEIDCFWPTDHHD